jgi:hypothetical protein
MPSIAKASSPRIVNLSSSEHFRHPKNGIDFDRINDEKVNTFVRYGTRLTYKQVKASSPTCSLLADWRSDMAQLSLPMLCTLEVHPTDQSSKLNSLKDQSNRSRS